MHTDDAVGGVLALLLIGYVLTDLLFPSSSDGHQLMGSTTAFLITTAVLFAALAAAYVPLGDHMARAFTSPRHLRVERLVYLAKLRKKLEPEPSRPRHLLTEPGLSVRLQP